jgi:hypothetical protein
MAAYGNPGKQLADDLRKRKKKKNAPEEAEAPEASAEVAESDKELKSAADAVDELLGENAVTPTDADEGGVTAAPPAEGGDPAEVFAEALGMSPEMAQAVYNEAMNMPELSEMSPEQMVKEIDGNYEMLKKLIQGVSERAEMAMQAAMEAPMPPPDMGGPGGAPMGPDMGAQPPMM